MAWWGSQLLSAALERFLSSLKKTGTGSAPVSSSTGRLNTGARRYPSSPDEANLRGHFESLLEDQLHRFGESDPRTLATRVDLANQLQEQGCWREACEQYEKALHRLRLAMGDDDPNVLTLQFAQAR